MLRSGFNAVTKIHSRKATLKRLGSPDIYSPANITPSNFFRFLRGPEYTTIAGKEFIIPVDSIKGHFAQKIVFSSVPISGDFKLTYNSNSTTVLDSTSTSASIQTALRLVAGLVNVVVAGAFPEFTVSFVGFQTSPLPLTVTDNTLMSSAPAAITSIVSNSYTIWGSAIKKGDRIVEANSILTIDEVMDMHDLGGAVMGYRVRAE